MPLRPALSTKLSAHKGTRAFEFVKDLVLEVRRFPLTCRRTLSSTSSPVAGAATTELHCLRCQLLLQDSKHLHPLATTTPLADFSANKISHAAGDRESASANSTRFPHEFHAAALRLALPPTRAGANAPPSFIPPRCACFHRLVIVSRLDLPAHSGPEFRNCLSQPRAKGRRLFQDCWLVRPTWNTITRSGPSQEPTRTAARPAEIHAKSQTALGLTSMSSR